MTQAQKTLMLDKMARSGYRTFTELAKEMSMTPTALSHRVNGKVVWNANEIKRLIELLKLNSTDAVSLFLR